MYFWHRKHVAPIIVLALLLLLAAAAIQAAPTLALSQCRDVTVTYDVAYTKDIPGAYTQGGQATADAPPSNAAAICTGLNEVVVGIAAPKFQPYVGNGFNPNALPLPSPEPSPKPAGKATQTARCCQLSVADAGQPVTFVKNGPAQCSDPTNRNNYVPQASFAHRDYFNFVDTYPNYVYGSTDGVVGVYACNNPVYTSNHGYTDSGQWFAPGGTLNSNGQIAGSAVFYTTAGGNTIGIPSCCAVQALAGPTTVSPRVTQTSWHDYRNSINGQAAALCPPGKFVIGMNTITFVPGRSDYGVLCGTLDLSDLPAPVTQACSITTTTTCQRTTTQTESKTCDFLLSCNKNPCSTGYTKTFDTCQRANIFGLEACWGGSITCSKQTQSTYQTTGACLSGDVAISSSSQQTGCGPGCFNGINYLSSGSCINGQCQYANGQPCPVPAPQTGTPYCQGNNVVRTDTTYTPTCQSNACSTTTTQTTQTVQTCPNGCSNGACIAQPSPTPTPSAPPQGENTLIADSENNRVIEVDANKNIVWKYPDGPKSASTLRPKYATRLANGNTLITTGNAIFEVNPSKQIVWTYGTPNAYTVNRYASAERLPNGNTLVSDAYYYLSNTPTGYGQYDGQVFEVDLAKKIVWQYTTEIDHDYILPGFENQNYAGKYYKQKLYPRTAFRLTNGNTLIADAGSDRVLEVTPDKQIVWNYGPRTIPVHDYLRPSGAYTGFAVRLPNGNTLLTDMVQSNVSEITAAGANVREYKNTAPNDVSRINAPSSAVQLPSGNLLVADYANHRVIEVDAAGQIVWQFGTTGVASETGLRNPQTAFRVTPILLPVTSPTPTPNPLCRTAPRVSKFNGAGTTNINALLSNPLAELKSVNGFTLDAPGSVKITYRSSVNVCNQDLDANVNFGPGFVSFNDAALDSSLVRGSSGSALATVILSYPSAITRPQVRYASGFHNDYAQILQTAQPCPANLCQNLVFVNGKAIFDAASFSDYIVTNEDTPTPSPNPSGSPTPNPSVSPNPSGPPPFDATTNTNELKARCPAGLVVEENTTVSVFFAPRGRATCVNQGMQLTAFANNTFQSVAYKTCDTQSGRHDFSIDTTTGGSYQVTARFSTYESQCRFDVVGRAPTPTPELSAWLIVAAALLSFGLVRGKTQATGRKK